MKKIENIISNLNRVEEFNFYNIKKEDFGGKSFTIYENPNKHNISDIVGEGELVKFITLERYENVYIFSPVVEYDEVIDRMSLLNNLRGHLHGSGKKRGNEIELYYIENSDKDSYNERILAGEYDWLERYNFDLDSYKRFIS